MKIKSNASTFSDSSLRWPQSVLAAGILHLLLGGLPWVFGPTFRAPRTFENEQEFEVELLAPTPTTPSAATLAPSSDPASETPSKETESPSRRKTQSTSIPTTSPNDEVLEALHEGSPNPALPSDPPAANAKPSSAIASAAPRKGLSLAQLGIGQAPRLRAPRLEDQVLREKRATEERLRRSLAQGLVDQDTQKGVGPQGEVRGALLRSTREARLTRKSSARLLVSLGHKGAVDTVRVLSSTSLKETWDKIALATRNKLTTKTLTIPSTARGAELRFKLEHDFLLPSGKARGGGQKEPYLKDTSFNASFDVADVGKVAQPVVRAHLESFLLL